MRLLNDTRVCPTSGPGVARAALRLAREPSASRMARAILHTVRRKLGDHPVEVLFVEETRYLRVETSTGFLPERGPGCCIPLGVGITGRAARENRVVWCPEVARCPDYIPAVPGARWEIAFPVRYRGDVVAVVDVESPAPEYPPPGACLWLARYLVAAGPILGRQLQVEALTRAALLDGLTGVHNYRYLQQALRSRAGGDSKGQPFSLVVFDLDRFKEVNDAFGHGVGDAVLRRTAEVLRALARPGEVVARYGGDEFVVLLASGSRDAATRRARNMARHVEHGLVEILPDWGDPSRPSVSFGVAVFPDDGTSPQQLIRAADEALYANKHSRPAPLAPRAQRGGGVPARGPALRFPRNPLQDLERLVDEERFGLAAQPIVAMGDATPLGHEVLFRGEPGTRWERPAEVFATARGTLLVRLEVSLFRLAVRWLQTGGAPGLLFYNVSPLTLLSGEWQEVLAAARSEERLSLDRLVLEIPESHRLPGLEQVLAPYRAGAPGLKVAIDDFGTGYANLEAALRLKPDFIKLDRSLIRGVDRDFGKRTMAESFSHFCRRLGVELIAEGVETATEAATLQALGIRWGQGFFWQPPQTVIGPWLEGTRAGHRR